MITTRGKVVLGLAIALGLVLAFILIDHINWVGNHYCFKSMNECYLGGK